jgi:pimeloyl-ACP methyl ester carboxylesterase
VAVSLSHYWPGNDACIRSEFGWQSHVAELAEFIDATGIGPVHLVGHSRGGCVAFQLARAYPHLVKTLTLADPGGPLQIDGTPQASLPPATQALRAKVADLIETGDIDAGLALFVDSVSVPGYWRKSPSSFRTMAIDNAATLPKQFRDAMPAYSRAGAADVKCRTLLIEGEKSPRMYRNNVDRLANWIACADKQTVAGASHGMSVTHPAAFNRLVQAFLAERSD